MSIAIADLRNDWAGLSDLLDEALALPREARATWLAGLQGPHAAHRAALGAILASAPAVETNDFLDALPRFGVPAEAGGVAGGHAGVVDPPAPGGEVGPYRLLEAIGSGGMGAVWLAERSDGQPRRKVALKLPHLGWEPGLAARLERERDILASLEHPHIARLYDAGLDAYGRPYLAMEYVDGTPIDRYVAEHTLPLRARLGLVLQVAAAVAHAHARLVVHRDLKPANILVTESGDVRLLDFGIAGIAQPDAAFESALTRESGRALTPDYASPEQIRGEAIGTASDVYSLGVVTYELVTGTRPYRLQGQGSAALAAALARVDVAPPSRAATDPALRHQLAGDLDAILGKALKQDPSERYATVDAFAADIRHHLQHEPVSARPDRFAYRLRKFVARHRWQTASAAVAVVALIGGAGVALWQAREARLEAARAEQVKAFALSMLDSADSDAGAGATTTAVDLLQAARQRVEIELAGRPAIAAELMTAIGFGLLGQGRPEDAATLLAKAVALSTQANGADDARTLAAQVVYGEALVDLGKNGEAIALLKPAAERAHRMHDRHAEIDARRWISSALIEKGELDAAIDSSRAAVAALGNERPTDRRSLLDAMQAHLSLANALNGGLRPGVTDAARAALGYAAELSGGRRMPQAAGARVMLGQGLVREGKVEAGVHEIELGYADLRSLLGDDHPQTEMTAGALGNVRMEAGDPQGAVIAYQAAFDAVMRRQAGRSPSAIAVSYYILAGGLAAAHERERALPLFAEAARLYALAEGPTSPMALRSRSSHALTLARLGRLDEAEREFAALAAMPFAGTDKATHAGRLAVLRSLQARHDEAIALARSTAEALATFPSKTLRAQSQAALGSALLAAGRAAEAVPPLERAVALYEEAQPRVSADHSDAIAALARARAASAGAVVSR